MTSLAARGSRRIVPVELHLARLRRHTLLASLDSAGGGPAARASQFSAAEIRRLAACPRLQSRLLKWGVARAGDPTREGGRSRRPASGGCDPSDRVAQYAIGLILNLSSLGPFIDQPLVTRLKHLFGGAAVDIALDHSHLAPPSDRIIDSAAPDFVREIEIAGRRGLDVLERASRGIASEWFLDLGPDDHEDRDEICLAVARVVAERIAARRPAGQAD